MASSRHARAAAALLALACAACRSDPGREPAPEIAEARPFSRVFYVTVGIEHLPEVLVTGPAVVTQVRSTCPAEFQLRVGSEVRPVTPPLERLVVPEGARLEIVATGTVCTGTVTVGGWEPGGPPRPDAASR